MQLDIRTLRIRAAGLTTEGSETKRERDYHRDIFLNNVGTVHGGHRLSMDTAKNEM